MKWSSQQNIVDANDVVGNDYAMLSRRTVLYHFFRSSPFGTQRNIFFLILNTSTFTFGDKTPPVTFISFHFLRKTLIIQFVFKLFKADEVTACVLCREGATSIFQNIDICSSYFIIS